MCVLHVLGSTLFTCSSHLVMQRLQKGSSQCRNGVDWCSHHHHTCYSQYCLHYVTAHIGAPTTNPNVTGCIAYTLCLHTLVLPPPPQMLQSVLLTQCDCTLRCSHHQPKCYSLYGLHIVTAHFGAPTTNPNVTLNGLRGR